MADFKGKNIVVVGGSGLLGKPITQGIKKHGARVIVVDPNADKDIEADEIIAENFVNREADTKTFFSELVKKYGEIHGFVNCSYPRTKDWGKDLFEISLESWKENVDLHLNSYFMFSQIISTIMKTQKNGSIINFSSIYGLVGPNFTVYEGTPLGNTPAYAAIKGGISNLTRYLATKLGPFNIRVNAICPGGVFDDQNGKFVENYSRITPLRRMATPDDIVGPVIFLLSDAARYITGVNLPVDGGWTAL